jgi:tetratricopeptide (TPR) repeat protein
VKIRVVALVLLAGVLCASAQQPVNPQSSAVRDISSALRSQRFDEGIKLSEAALKSSPKDPRLWTLLGMSYSGLHKPDEALASFDHALKILPKFLPALEGAAQIEYSRGDPRSVILLQQILEQRPSDATTHAMLAVMDYKKGECSSAIVHFRQAGELISSQPGALSEYGSCLVTLEKFEEAVPIFRQLVEMQPNAHQARYNLALDQWKAKHPEDAILTLRPAIDSKDAEENILSLAADIYESMNDTPRAVELLRMAILNNPKDPQAYLQFATLSYNHVSYQVGIDMLNAGLTQLPNSAQLYLARGVLYTQLGDTTRGMADFETANRLEPELSFAATAQGLMQAEQHNSAGALATFRVQAKQHPNDAYTQYLLAEALSELGTPQGSQEYNEEVAAATRAVELDPKLVAAHDLLGTLYLQAGKNELAIQHCELSLEADHNDQQALYHLILALRKTDRKGEIPQLMKRLTDLRSSTQTETAKGKRYKLIEGPAPTPAPAKE